MHDVISHTLKHIYFNIPKQILDITFLHNVDRKGNYATLDDAIIDLIILGKVREDVNIQGGRKKAILLKQEYLEETEIEHAVGLALARYGLYRIPPEEREHQNINRVVQVTQASIYAPGAGIRYSQNTLHNSVMGSANQMLYSQTFNNVSTTPQAEVIQGDLIKLISPQHSIYMWMAHCIIGYDEFFTNMNPQAYKPFKELVLLATKIFINTELSLAIETNAFRFGHEFAQFRDTVMDYREAFEMYEPALNRFLGAGQLDKVKLHHTLRMMV